MNIVVHLVGLVHLCFANFALLHAVDEALFGERFPMFAAVTAIGWSYLLTARATRAPWSVRACACAVICGAFAARRLWHPRVFTTVAFIEAPFHALIWRFGDGKALPTTQPLLLWLLVVALIAAPVYNDDVKELAHGALAAPTLRLPLNVAAVCALYYGSVDPFQKRLNCYWAGCVGWLLALLTDQPAMAFYGSGYVASLLQGVAHEQTGEKANLPELAKRSGPQKAGDEHAHTAFFPCLILHSAHESLTRAAA